MKEERTLLAALTPTLYTGAAPPYWNFTAISGGSVGRLHKIELTVRQPTPPPRQFSPAGETKTILVAEMNTALKWKEFVKCVNEADKKFDAINYLDSQ